jgi:hypothetical protein
MRTVGASDKTAPFAVLAVSWWTCGALALAACGGIINDGDGDASKGSDASTHAPPSVSFPNQVNAEWRRRLAFCCDGPTRRGSS